mmetsp:Transcript_20703/g.30541  ORF Transcript_20703/g.30541 Transcript_20703/m.30541 type:complete len:86 (-) Transcript_20703:179-436(-)
MIVVDQPTSLGTAHEACSSSIQTLCVRKVAHSKHGSSSSNKWKVFLPEVKATLQSRDGLLHHPQMNPEQRKDSCQRLELLPGALA